MTPEQLAKSGSERAHQTALFCWAAIEAQNIPELTLMFAIPNGGERNIIVATQMKAEGVKRGVPDIFLPVPRGSYSGLFIELKKVGGKVSSEQTHYLVELKRQGFACTVCVGWEQARDAILAYMNWKG